MKIKLMISILILILITSFSCGGKVILDKTETDFLNLINNARIQNGLNLLIPNQNLMDLAKSRCEDMINRNYLSHYTPEGKRVRYGEIIAKTTLNKKDKLELIFNYWLSSRIHKEVIMNPIYRKIGIEIIDNKDYRIIVILFSSR